MDAVLHASLMRFFLSPQDKGICLLIYHALLFAPGLRDVVYSCPMSLAHHLFPNLFLPADQTLHKIPSYYLLILIIPCNQTRGIHVYTITTFYRMVCSQYINCQQWKLFGPKTANYHFLHRLVTTTYLQSEGNVINRNCGHPVGKLSLRSFRDKSWC